MDGGSFRSWGSLTSGQLALVDAQCVRFEQALADNLVPRIEDYLDSLPTELRTVALEELLRVEIQSFQIRGIAISAEEYRNRFSAQLELVEAVLASHPTLDSGHFDPTSDQGSWDDSETVAQPSSAVSTEWQAPSEPPANIERYQTLRVLGEGRFGRVYLAYDPELDRRVAIKVPGRNWFAESNNVGSFLAEARSIAKLKHPGIVSVYDVQQTEGLPYIVQELIDGPHLGDWVRLRPPSHAAIARLMYEVAEAVNHAHRCGILHRDLKPGNILIDPDGHAHVADFGLALHHSGLNSHRNELAGTPPYMSPEQLRCETQRLDARSDLWALGVILYELLTGKRPFVGEPQEELFRAITYDDPPAPRQVDSRVPAELERICLKCLKKRASDRYASAAELTADLRRWSSPPTPRPTARSHRVVRAGLLAAGLLLLAGVAHELRSFLEARSLVQGLLAAKEDQLHEFINQVPASRRWANSRLISIIRSPADDPVARRRQLHARLALVTYDRTQVPALVESLFTAEVEYVGVLIAALQPYQEQILGDLWHAFHDPSAGADRRFRAGLALAACNPDSASWRDGDAEFLVEQLVDSNPIHQECLRDSLRPARKQCLPHLQQVLFDTRRPGSQHLAAADALADYARNDPPLISRCLVRATPAPYRILFSSIRDAEQFTRVLRELAAEQPSDGLGEEERVSLGKRRASAAITLLRLGRFEACLEGMRVREDPEFLTQFAHRCTAFDVTPEQLWQCLLVADRDRRERYGPDRNLADRAIFGLILALGEYRLEQLPAAERVPLVEQLVTWMTHDPSAAIHGAARWCLRRWGHADRAAIVDRMVIPYQSDREWFTLRFRRSPAATKKTSPDPFVYMTFVVIPAGEYLVGSPKDELERLPTENVRPVRLTRPFAIADREITWEQFSPSDSDELRQYATRQSGKPSRSSDPAIYVTWFETIRYCRWLTSRIGMSESDQCYPDLDFQEEALDREAKSAPVSLDRPGFRLPTDSEWEIACRAGTRTPFSFGSDRSLLPYYGWFRDNGNKWSNLAGELRPNLHGLFDMHGNASEWCHDRFDARPAGKLVDYVGPEASRHGWCDRNGDWNSPARNLRSAFRDGDRRSYRRFYRGFRIVVTPQVFAETTP